MCRLYNSLVHVYLARRAWLVTGIQIAAVSTWDIISLALVAIGVWSPNAGNKGKVKQSIYRPITSQEDTEVEAPTFRENRHIKMVGLSVLCPGRLYPLRNTPGTHFYWSLSWPQGHSATGRTMWMTNSYDTIGNRNCDFLFCSAVAQPTAAPRASVGYSNENWLYQVPNGD